MTYDTFPRSEVAPVQKWESNVAPLDAFMGFRCWYLNPEDRSQTLLSPWFSLREKDVRALITELQNQLVVLEGVSKMQGRSN